MKSILIMNVRVRGKARAMWSEIILNVKCLACGVELKSEEEICKLQFKDGVFPFCRKDYETIYNKYMQPVKCSKCKKEFNFRAIQDKLCNECAGRKPFALWMLDPFDWSNEKDVEVFESYLHTIKEEDPETYNLYYQGNHSFQGRIVSFPEFVRSLLSVGSKEKHFDCPLQWSQIQNSMPDISEYQGKLLRKTMPAIVSPMKCHIACPFGHMTECHFPNDCDSDACNHYDRDGGSAFIIIS